MVLYLMSYYAIASMRKIFFLFQIDKQMESFVAAIGATLGAILDGRFMSLGQPPEDRGDPSPATRRHFRMRLGDEKYSDAPRGDPCAGRPQLIPTCYVM